MLEKESRAKQILLATVNNKEFALEVINIQEIIRLVEITKVPGTPHFIHGVINYRGKIVPILSLVRILELSETNFTLNSFIIICRFEQNLVGFFVDDIKMVVEIFDENIDTTTNRLTVSQYIKGIIKLGENLISLLDINKVFYDQQNVLREISKKPIKDGEIRIEETSNLSEDDKKELRKRSIELSETESKDENIKNIKLLSFLLGSEWYGIELDYSKEIIDSPQIFNIPNTQNYIRGVINLREELMAVVDLPLYIGLSNKIELRNKWDVIIIQVKDIEFGLLVNDVSDILEISDTEIQYTFGNIEEEKARVLLKGEVTIGNIVIGILNINKIIENLNKGEKY